MNEGDGDLIVAVWMSVNRVFFWSFGFSAFAIWFHVGFFASLSVFLLCFWASSG